MVFGNKNMSELVMLERKLKNVLGRKGKNCCNLMRKHNFLSLIFLSGKS